MSARQRRRRQRRRQGEAGRASARPARIIVGTGLTLSVGLGFSSTAQAAVDTLTVGTTGDTSGASDCTTATNTDCSLRDAVTASQDGDTTDQDAIVFKSGLTGTITLGGSQLPTVTEPLYVDGPGAGTLTVSGNNQSRIFYLNGSGDDPVTIEGLTLTEGQGDNSNGGAISVSDGDFAAPEPDLTVKNSAITGNQASGGGGISAFRGSVSVQNSDVSHNSESYHTYNSGGGAIYLFPGLTGTLTIYHSTLSDNQTGSQSSEGGAVHSLGPATIQSSTISGNSTSGDYSTGGGLNLQGNINTIQDSTISGNYTDGPYADGGGISVGAYSHLTIDRSTVSGNTTYGLYARGGGVSSIKGDAPTIADSTITGNYTYTNGGGIYAKGAIPAMTLANTVVAGNGTANSGPDLYSPDESFHASFSLIQNTADATIDDTVAGSNITGVDPLLGPLSDNGGPTFTEAPLSGSPLVDAGSSAATVDQRGLLRPVTQVIAKSIAAGANCADIGAFELQVTGGGPGPTCQLPAPPPSGGGNPSPAQTPAKKKCKKKKKHKSSAQSAKKCKKKKKK